MQNGLIIGFPLALTYKDVDAQRMAIETNGLVAPDRLRRAFEEPLTIAALADVEEVYASLTEEEALNTYAKRACPTGTPMEHAAIRFISKFFLKPEMPLREYLAEMADESHATWIRQAVRDKKRKPEEFDKNKTKHDWERASRSHRRRLRLEEKYRLP